MNARSLVMTVLLALGAVALGAQASQQPAPAPDPQPRMQQRGPRPMRMEPREFVAPGERLKQHLGLSDEQVASLEKLMSEQRKAAIRQEADQRIARLELEELLRADALDDQAVDAKIRQMTELQASALRARVQQRVAMRKVLTAEQFQKWQQMRGRGGERLVRPRMQRGERPMRWRDDRGWRLQVPMPPPPPEAPNPPAAPEGDPVPN